MIVKVQMSWRSSDNVQRVLIYNQDESFSYEGGINQDMIDTMAERPKAYFEAKIVGGLLEIGEEVEGQDW